MFTETTPIACDFHSNILGGSVCAIGNRNSFHFNTVGPERKKEARKKKERKKKIALFVGSNVQLIQWNCAENDWT